MDPSGFETHMESAVERGAVSPETARTYSATVRQFADWFGTIGEPSPEDVKDWIRYMADEKGLSNASIKRHTFGMARYFFYADRSGEFTEVKDWRREHYPVGGADVPEHFSRAEEDALREAAELSPRANAIVSLLLATGMRVTELCGLGVSDVRFDVGTPVPKPYADLGPDDRSRIEGGDVRVQRAKRREDVSNRLPLTKPDTDALTAYLDERDEYTTERGCDSPWLFPTTQRSNDGEWRISEQMVRHILNRVAREADGVDADDVHPHKFRHTVGARLGMAGRSTAEISRYLGQASAQSAERYTHFDQESFEDMRGDVDSRSDSEADD